jgi:hypothetical protein
MNGKSDANVFYEDSYNTLYLNLKKVYTGSYTKNFKWVELEG